MTRQGRGGHLADTPLINPVQLRRRPWSSRRMPETITLVSGDYGKAGALGD